MLDEIKAVLTASIDKFKQKMEEAKKISSNVEKSVELSSLKTKKALDKAFSSGKTVTIGESMNVIRKKIDNVGRSADLSIGKGLAKSVETSTHKIKRLMLAMFSVESIFALISRASMSYQQQDTETANKVQSAWFGLGSFLAPVMEYIANLMLKALAYINAFVKALTGIDFVARANAKALRKQADATKEATKSTASFDVINNLSDGANSNQSEAMQVNVPELPQATLDKIDAFAQKILSWKAKLQPIFDWLANNWKTVLSLILLLGTVFDIITGNWIGLIVKFVAFMILNWSDLWKAVQDIVKIAIDIVIAIFQSLREMIKGIVALIMSVFKTGIDFVVGVIKSGIDLIINIFKTISSAVAGVVDGVKSIFNGIITFITGIFTGNWKKAWEGVKSVFKGIFDTLYAIIKAPINLIIDAINFLIGGLDAIKWDVPDWVPVIGGKRLGFNIPKIPKLEIGTNYIPQNGMYYLHEGESVTPKQYNPAVTGNNQPIYLTIQVGNEKLLDQVINGINEKNRIKGVNVIRGLE